MTNGRRGIPTQRPWILFVEDNPTHLDLYAIFLEKEFEVLRAARGEEGYALAISDHPSAALIDVLLPDVDGLTLCQRLRDNPVTAPMPIIVLTGDDDAFARAETLRFQLRLKDVLMKPCSADRLLSVLRAATTTV